MVCTHHLIGSLLNPVENVGNCYLKHKGKRLRRFRSEVTRKDTKKKKKKKKELLILPKSHFPTY